ncbi:uncharacterized protein [Physcomitrium patens]|nr:homeobox-leucine zipper protein HOX20-like [Physcomitrium patens]PNR36411.1 hypothetical protein PHYPA_022262 [Physcomitrium patens]|eukprot:XP_024401525.1 homeobox-leucine zipper protein HOX20-like [Physcomitrella patens]
MAMAATGLSSFGGQNVMLMRNDMGSSNSLVAMLNSCNPHVSFQVSRLGGGLEDAIAGCGQKRPFFPTFGNGPGEEPEDGDDGGDDGSQPVEKKRRLSFDQVRSLERSFEVENKLEPERKMQLAKELGLQPRQVAVWFQNRRARWKTKQLERDYEMLNSGYIKLKADFETALREKDVLKAEVQRLSGKTSPQGSQSSQSADSSQCESDSHCMPDTEESPKLGKKPYNLAITKDHHHTRSSPTMTVCSTPKLEVEKTSTSSGSNSSDLLDADSPHTSDSNPSDEEKLACCSQFPPPESLVGPLGVDDDVNASQQSFPVKLEEGCHAFQVDPNCGYFFAPAVEQSVLPWWDWP